MLLFCAYPPRHSFSDHHHDAEGRERGTSPSFAASSRACTRLSSVGGVRIASPIAPKKRPIRLPTPLAFWLSGAADAVAGPSLIIAKANCLPPFELRRSAGRRALCLLIFCSAEII